MSCQDNFPVFPFFTGYFGPWWDWAGYERPRSSNCPPSPTPPWARAIQSPLVQVVVQNDTINIDMLMTYLNQALNSPPAPVQVALPNGTYLGQEKHIYIAGDKVTKTETFVINGTFAGGYTHLTFNTTGFSARLSWDGATWQLTGGNATLS